MTDTELTKEEKSAIRRLKLLAKKWPKTLWLFSASSLFVMRTGIDGEHVHTQRGSVDPDYVITTIDIDHSGGDW